MKLSTGKIAFPVEFDNGDKEFIYFNPNDPDLFIRLSETQARISERIKNLSDFEINTDGTPKKQEDYELFKTYRQIMCEEINRAFDNNVSDVLFKHVNPLAITDGQYYVSYVLQALMPEILAEIEKARAELETKMMNYIKEYV